MSTIEREEVNAFNIIGFQNQSLNFNNFILRNFPFKSCKRGVKEHLSEGNCMLHNVAALNVSNGFTTHSISACVMLTLF